MHLDVAVLAMYCHLWERLQDIAKELKKAGYFYTTETGYKRSHPLVAEKEKVIRELRQLASQLCLSPSSRKGVKLKSDAKRSGLQLLQAEADKRA